METANILSLLVGIAGLIYAIYQSYARAKLQRAIQAQSWLLYSKADNSTGAMQKALSLYKDKHQNEFHPEVLEVLAKADAFGQDVFKDTIKQIQFFEKKFDRAHINKWISDGRVSESHGQLFKLLAPSEKPN